MRVPRPRTLRATVGLMVVTLVALLVATALATVLARREVASAQRALTTRALPAREAVADLGQAYVDQETGQRGYLLTGDPRLLAPYTAGTAVARRATTDLGRLLADDPAGLRALHAVSDDAAVWRTTIAEPEIAARRRGPIPADQWQSIGLDGKARFDRLRADLAALETRTAALASAEVATIGRAQTIANAVTAGAVVLALVVAAGGAVVFRRRFSLPLGRLVTQVRAVAGGERDMAITPAGPSELALIARSVETMRQSLVDHGRELAAAQRDLTLREEHDRLATDLHDLTIQRVFALGLSLTSISRRQPELAPALAPLIAETDRIIREVRSVIFDLGSAERPQGLRRQVVDLAEDSTRALGFAPALDFSGPVDQVPERIADSAVAVLREALANVARHAAATEVAIRVHAAPDTLEVLVSDNGKGPGSAPPGDGIAGIHARAGRLGGTATVAAGEDGGTAVGWRVPLPARPSAQPA